MILPILVRRSTPSTPPGAAPSVRTKSASESRGGRMDRNFKQSNGTPSRPIRSCAKKMGPGELARTSTVSRRNTGDSSSRASPAVTRSSAPLRTNCHPLGSTCRSTIRGSPPRCSMRACIPTVSNMRGTSQTRAPACCAARIASTICSCGADANAITISSTRCTRSIRVRSVSGPRYESSCCTQGSTLGEESTVPTRSIPYSEDSFILRASCSVTGPLPTMTVGALAWCFARSQRCPHARTRQAIVSATAAHSHTRTMTAPGR